MKLRNELAIVLVLLVVSAPARLLGLDLLPPGLFHDEAYEGLDAVRILAGARPVFLPENYGREPLYAYVMAALIALDGPTVVAVRATSAIFGLLTIPAAYLWGRVFFGPGAGLLVAVLTTSSYWLLHESRLGLRPIALVPFLALSSALVWLAARQERWWAWPLAGATLGLSLYTYLPARLFAIVILGQAAIALVVAPASPRKLRGFLGLLAMLLITALISAPLVLHFQQTPEDFSARANVVSIFSKQPDNPVAAVLSNLAPNLAMFVWQGDETLRHNLPYRPVFDWLIAPFFLLGSWCSLRLIRRPEQAALWLWLGVMFLPGILSDSAPHFLRTIGLLPALFALPALGLVTCAEWCWTRLSSTPAWRPWAAAPAAGLVLVLLSSQLLTWRDYFILLPQQPGLDGAFDAPRAALARVAGKPPPGTNLDLPTPGWSYATIRFLRPRSFELPSVDRPAQFRFGTQVVLLGYSLDPDVPQSGQPAKLTLYWRALRELNASYVESARLVDQYGRVFWQWQGVPGAGTLPTDTWQPGEIVADHLMLDLAVGTPASSLTLEVSLAQPGGGRRLPVYDPAGRQIGESVKLERLQVERRG